MIAVILRREIRAHRRSLFFWSIAMALLIVSSMGKFATYTASGASIQNMLDQFPHTVQVVFGISGFDLSTASGFYGVTFMYIALLASVHAVLLGSDIIAKEERDRTTEFLFARPVSRTNVITAKLLAGAICLIVFNLVTFMVSLYSVYYFSKGEWIAHYMMLLMIGLFMMQFIFFSVGAGIAGWAKRPKMASSIATALLLATFLLMFIVNLSDNLNPLKYLTPFKYFDAKEILQNNALDPLYIGISAVLIVLATLATYIFYNRRDLSV